VDLVAVRGQALGGVELAVAFWALEVGCFLMLHQGLLILELTVTVVAKYQLLILLLADHWQACCLLG